MVKVVHGLGKDPQFMVGCKSFDLPVAKRLLRSLSAGRMRSHLHNGSELRASGNELRYGYSPAVDARKLAAVGLRVIELHEELAAERRAKKAKTKPNAR